MGIRPLDKEEIASLQERLAKAKEHLHPIAKYVRDLENQLADGAIWESDTTQEECRQMEQDGKAFLAWLEDTSKPFPVDLCKYNWSWKVA